MSAVNFLAAGVLGFMGYYATRTAFEPEQGTRKGQVE